MLLIFVPVFGLQLLPTEWQARLLSTLSGIGTESLTMVMVIALAILDAGLLRAAAARFRRGRLIAG